MIEIARADLAVVDAVAAALAQRVQAGEVVCLHGGVGAGKTTFTGRFARALGILEPVRSPTYTVAHTYLHPDGERTFAHLDCYRGDGSVMDVEAFADLEPILRDATWTCIEWPSTIEPWLVRRPTWTLTLDIVDAETRSIALAGPRAIELDVAP